MHLSLIDLSSSIDWSFFLLSFIFWLPCFSSLGIGRIIISWFPLHGRSPLDNWTELHGFMQPVFLFDYFFFMFLKTGTLLSSSASLFSSFYFIYFIYFAIFAFILHYQHATPLSSSLCELIVLIFIWFVWLWSSPVETSGCLTENSIAINVIVYDSISIGMILILTFQKPKSWPWSQGSYFFTLNLNLDIFFSSNLKSLDLKNQKT